MAIGDLRGRVVITNSSQGTLRAIKSDMDGIANASRRISFANLNSQIANATRSLKLQMDRLQKMTGPAAGVAAGAGLGARGLIEQTRDFNESKFGYGFARLSDYVKNGQVDLKAWRADMNATAKAVQAKATEYGALPDMVMKAREEVEKLGFKGNESNSLWDAALGLHLSEPSKMAAGQAAQYLGAVYRAFEKERVKMAAKEGVEPDNPEFVQRYIKGMAAKAAIAGAESALGPADVVEGMRQYAPQWAGLGISYDFALAALSHGANYGFRAPELGTAYKSMAMRAIKPTAEGMRWYNRLGIDRSKYMDMDVADPKRATNQLDALLGNSLGKNNKHWLEQTLIGAQKGGYTNKPEFRGELINNLEKRLGKGWVGRRGELESAYDDAFLAPTKFKDGGFDGLIRDIIKSKAGPSALGTMFEGRHIARNDPMFSFYDKMHGLFEKINATDGSFMDAVVAGRKDSEAGKTDQVLGSWKSLMIALEQSGGVIDKLKDIIIGLNTALAAMSPEALTALTTAVVGIGAVAATAMAAGALAKAAPVAGAVAKFGWSMTGIPAAVGGVGALAGWGLGRAGMIPGNVVGAPIGAAGPIIGGAQAAGRSMSLLGGMRAVAVGVGRFLIPGIGILTAAQLGYGAYQGYKATGTVGGALRGADGAGDAAAEDGPTDAMGATTGASGLGGPEQDARSTAEQMLQPFREIDLTAEGQRIMATLAAGIRAGGAEAIAAAQEVAAGVRAASESASGPVKVPLNTGPTMSGSAR